MVPLSRQGTRKRKWGTTHSRDKNRISRMNGSPSAACSGNSSHTLKSLNEVKKNVYHYVAFPSEPDRSSGSDIHLRGPGKHAHRLDRDEPISMLIRFGAAVGEIAIFVPGSLCYSSTVEVRGGGSVLHAAEWQCELGVGRGVGVSAPDEKNC